jgi:hypothetical protein
MYMYTHKPEVIKAFMEGDNSNTVLYNGRKPCRSGTYK